MIALKAHRYRTHVGPNHYLPLTDWCKKYAILCTVPPINSVVNFLSELFKDGLEWRTINVYRSTLLSTLGYVDNVPVGQHPLVR